LVTHLTTILTTILTTATLLFPEILKAEETTNNIGKTANPFQVIVVPALFVFYVLLFGHIA